VEFAVKQSDLRHFGVFSRLFVCGSVLSTHPKGETSSVFPASNHTRGYYPQFSYNSFYGFPLINGIVPNFSAHLNSYATASVQQGDFNDIIVWLQGVVPNSKTLAYILHDVSLSGNQTANMKSLVTIPPNGALECTEKTQLVFGDQGIISNQGSWTSAGTVTFNGSLSVLGTAAINLNQVKLAAGQVAFGQSASILGKLIISRGTAVSNPLGYGLDSSLIYNGGDIHPRGTEWCASEGNGFPNSVLVTGNTTLDFGSYPGAAGVKGDLVIDPFSEVTLNFPSHESSAPLNIFGVLDNRGKLTISSKDGGSVFVKTIKNLGTLKCFSTTSSTLYLGQIPFNKPTIQANGPTNFTEGGMVILSVVSADQNSTYVWSPTNSPGSSLQVKATGHYSVTVTDQFGCRATSDNIVVTVQPPPTTGIPTTAIPTTAIPTTAIPTTGIPTTAIPTTGIPTTAIPTTAIPTTAIPTTGIPTTGIPTTGIPTTGIATTGRITTGAVVPPVESSAKGLSTYQILTIVFGIVGAIVGIVLVIVPIVILAKRRKKQREEDRELLLAVF